MIKVSLLGVRFDGAGSGSSRHACANGLMDTLGSIAMNVALACLLSWSITTRGDLIPLWAISPLFPVSMGTTY